MVKRFSANKVLKYYKSSIWGPESFLKNDKLDYSVKNSFEFSQDSPYAQRIKAKQITLIVDDKVKVKLSREGYNPLFGARPLRRLITKYVEDLVSENLLNNPLTKKNRTIRIILNNEDEITLIKMFAI